MTAIVVSHSAAAAVSRAGELAIIESERIVQRGAVHRVLAEPVTRFVLAVAATLPTTDMLP